MEDVRPDLARAFDSIGSCYDNTLGDKPGQVAAGEWVLTNLVPMRRNHPPLVLDVGCGTGVPTALQLTIAGCEVVGIDSSPVMLDLARRNAQDAIFVERDLTDLEGLHPVGDNFDAAVAFFSLLVLPRSEMGRALRQIRRELKPAAPFAVAMVESDTDFLLRDFQGVKVPLTGYPRDQLAAVLGAAGFQVEELTAESWQPVANDIGPQVHLYARCRAVNVG